MVKTWLVAGVVLLAAPGLVGCTSDPKISELGSDLQRDGASVLDQSARFGAAGGVKPTISDDASKDVPCDGGTMKRVFAGTFPFEPNPDVDTTFDLAYKTALGLLDSERFELTQRPDADNLVRREFVLTGKEDLKVTFTFTFTGGTTPVFAVRGETACLKS